MIKKTGLFKVLTAGLLTVILMAGLTFTAYAEGEYEDYLKSGSNFSEPAGESVVKDFLNSGLATDSQKDAVRKKLVTKNGEVADGTSNATDESITEAGRLVAGYANKQVLKNKVSGVYTDFNIEANTAAAAVALSGVKDVVRVIVGLICYAIVIFISLFTATDVCYITMPVFQNKCEEMKESGNSFAVKTDKNGESRVRWITNEAVYAVRSCALETGKNPLGMYLRKRIWAYVMLAIVLYILFTGNITLIVNIALNFVSGIMEALKALGQ